MFKLLTIPVCITLLLLSTQTALARDQIRVVGSSTVYPFVTVAAEKFGKAGKFDTPIIESTGTGGGLKLFCGGIGKSYPDFSNASRAIKDSERDMCADNGISNITEIKIGYDGIVLANAITAQRYNLTKEQIFRALGKKIPMDGSLADNPYEYWDEIDAALPHVKIEVYGPPPTSGTRDAFVELVMEKACKDLDEFVAAYPDKKMRKKACHLIREDGKYIEAGENDNLIVQKLNSNPNALGIFGYSFLDQNMMSVQGSLVEGVEPTFENISDGSYSVSRPLYVYAKNAHADVIPGIREFAKELSSTKAVGQEGYLTLRGLIPLVDNELKTVQDNVSGL